MLSIKHCENTEIQSLFHFRDGVGRAAGKEGRESQAGSKPITVPLTLGFVLGPQERDLNRNQESNT